MLGLTLLLAGVVLLDGCVPVRGRGPRVRSRVPPPVVVVPPPSSRPRPLPPPPPPVYEHREREHHRYHYYPGVEVYFDPLAGLYFFLEGGRWRQHRRLPPHIHLDVDTIIHLELDVDRPYLRHEETIRRYPPGKYRHKKKGRRHERERQSHRYHYYPRAEVYYDPGARLYFYLDRGKWRQERRLPPHIHLDDDHGVELDLDVDRPYLRHKDTIKQYPPGKYKKKKHKEHERERWER